MENVNIKRLAKELNLSISTVSRALRDSYEISAHTKEKVFALAKKLNYQPNPNASSLREQKTRTIAVIIPEIANNFFSTAINGIEKIAEEKGYHVLIYLTHEDTEREVSFTRHLSNGRVDGVLISVSCSTHDNKHLYDIAERNIPMVFFDRVSYELDNPKITTDDYESGFKATEHLIECGCKRIAHFMVSKNTSIGEKRMQGYIDALNKYDLAYEEELILDCSNNNEQSQEQIKKFMLAKTPDGIFSSVEKLAISCYYVCQDLKLNIPKDVKVISFSNLETAPLLDPPLTTITQPAYDMGVQAASILFDVIGKKTADHSTIVLQSALIKRRSTCMF